MEDTIEQEEKPFQPYFHQAGLRSVEQAKEEGHASDHALVYAEIPTQNFGTLRICSRNMFGDDQRGKDLPFAAANSEPKLRSGHNNFELVESVSVAARRLDPDFVFLQEVSTRLPPPDDRANAIERYPSVQITKWVVDKLGSEDFEIAKKTQTAQSGKEVLIGAADSVTFCKRQGLVPKWKERSDVLSLSGEFPLMAEVTLFTNSEGKRLCVWNVHAIFSCFPDVVEDYLVYSLGEFEDWCNDENRKYDTSEIEHVFGGDFNGNFAHADGVNCYINCTNVSTTHGDGKQIYKSPDGFFYASTEGEGLYQFTQPPVQIIDPKTGEPIYDAPPDKGNFPVEQQRILDEFHPVLALDQKWRTNKIIGGKTIFEYQQYLREKLKCNQIIVRPSVNYYGERAISIGFKQENAAYEDTNNRTKAIFDWMFQKIGSDKRVQKDQYNQLIPGGTSVTDSLITLSVRE